MIVRKNGGMTEFIPSPVEKRESLIRDNVLKLLINLDVRLSRVEQALCMKTCEMNEFAEIMMKIGREELEVEKVNLVLMTDGLKNGECTEL